MIGVTTVIARLRVVLSVRPPAVELISTTRVITCSFWGAVTLKLNVPVPFDEAVWGEDFCGSPPVRSDPGMYARIVTFPGASEAGPPVTFRENFAVPLGARAIGPDRFPVTVVCAEARGVLPIRTQRSAAVATIPKN